MFAEDHVLTMLSMLPVLFMLGMHLPGRLRLTDRSVHVNLSIVHILRSFYSVPLRFNGDKRRRRRLGLSIAHGNFNWWLSVGWRLYLSTAPDHLNLGLPRRWRGRLVVDLRDLRDLSRRRVVWIVDIFAYFGSWKGHSTHFSCFFCLIFASNALIFIARHKSSGR